MAADSTSHIYQSLVTNSIIAVAKFVAAFITGSGAMMAEAIHSTADCSNQGLLLLGVKRSRKQPDASHPLGYGREAYFWSFMVAMLLFSVGGAFSIYEGVHKTMHPEPVDHVVVGVGVLAFALVLEGRATYLNVKELDRRRGTVAFGKYLKQTKDADLVVVFGENSAATLGLLLALISLLIGWMTGNGVWDGIGSLMVGVVLIGVAIFLAVEVKGLLVGESAEPTIEKGVNEVIAADPNFEGLLRILTVQQGPGEVMVAMKVRLTRGLTGDQTCAAINTFERALEAKHPEIKWCFVEPDVEK